MILDEELPQYVVVTGSIVTLYGMDFYLYPRVLDNGFVRLNQYFMIIFVVWISMEQRPIPL